MKRDREERFPHLFFESSESYRVFNYLHDSNSIFRGAGINTEIFIDEHRMRDEDRRCGRC